MAPKKCPILKIALKGDPAKVLADAKMVAKKNDIIIKGDAQKGTMIHTKVDIKGSYMVKGKILAISMIDNTWMANCKDINEGVLGFFKDK